MFSRLRKQRTVKSTRDDRTASISYDLLVKAMQYAKKIDQPWIRIRGQFLDSTETDLFFFGNMGRIPDIAACIVRLGEIPTSRLYEWAPQIAAAYKEVEAMPEAAATLERFPLSSRPNVDGAELVRDIIRQGAGVTLEYNWSGSSSFVVVRLSPYHLFDNGFGIYLRDGRELMGVTVPDWSSSSTSPASARPSAGAARSHS